MERDFEVEVVHRDRAVYRIRAADREEAEKLAADRWRTGDDSDVPGYDWSELISCVGQPAADAERSRQDVEVVYRFLNERERLIQQLGGDPFNPSANDAISASQVAADLGWVKVAVAWYCSALYFGVAAPRSLSNSGLPPSRTGRNRTGKASAGACGTPLASTAQPEDALKRAQ